MLGKLKTNFLYFSVRMGWKIAVVYVFKVLFCVIVDNYLAVYYCCTLNCVNYDEVECGYIYSYGQTIF